MTLREIPHRLGRYGAALLALAGAGLGLAGCSPLSALDALVPARGYDRVADIAYGDDPRMRFDLYLPEAGAAPATPTVLFFYGGSWREGYKAGYRFVGQAFASRGIAVAVADYRLFPEVRFPTFAADAARAARRLVEVAPDHGLSRRFVAMGHSAGAHTAAMLALAPQYLEDAGVDPALRAGLIALSGPVYIDPLDYDTTRPVFADLAGRPDDGRPVAFVTPDDPPAYLVHGGADDTVSPLNTKNLAVALSDAGVPAEVEIREDEGHIGPLVALAAPFAERRDALADRLAAWLRELPAGGAQAAAQASGPRSSRGEFP